MAKASVKTVEWGGPGDTAVFPYMPPFETWGANGFTAQWASVLSQSGVTASGYLTAALRWKCEQLALAPFAVERKEKRPDGRHVWNIIEDHPLLDLLEFPDGRQRGVSYTRSEWLTRLLISYEIEGNAYAYRLRHAGGYTNRLQYLPWWQVTPVRDALSPNKIDFFRYTSGGQTTAIDPARMLHWKQGSNTGWPGLGWSPLKSVLAEIMSEREIAAYGYYIMRNSGATNLIITPPDFESADLWDEDTMKAVQTKLLDIQGNNTGGPLVTSTPINIQSGKITPEDMALDKVNQIPLVKILAVVGVDPAVLPAFQALFNQSKATNAKERNELAWKSALLPLGNSMAERLRIDVLPDFAENANITRERIVLDTREVWALQEDVNKLWERLDKSFLSGRLTQNESRAGSGHEEREGGDKTHNEFPQLINGQANQHDATLLNGTNGRLANETDRASRPNVADDAEAKTRRDWRRMVAAKTPVWYRTSVNPYSTTTAVEVTSGE